LGVPRGGRGGGGGGGRQSGPAGGRTGGLVDGRNPVREAWETEGSEMDRSNPSACPPVRRSALPPVRRSALLQHALDRIHSRYGTRGVTRASQLAALTAAAEA
jgi:hypothetical protein